MSGTAPAGVDIELATEDRPSGWYVTVALARPPAVDTASHPTAIVERVGPVGSDFELGAPTLIAVTAYSDLTDPLEAIAHVCEAMHRGELPSPPPAGEIKAIAGDVPPWGNVVLGGPERGYRSSVQSNMQPCGRCSTRRCRPRPPPYAPAIRPSTTRCWRPS